MIKQQMNVVTPESFKALDSLEEHTEKDPELKKLMFYWNEELQGWAYTSI